MREVGCMRLLAMEPLQNTIDRQAITDRTRTTHESESPVAGADVLFTPEGHNRAPLRRVTLAEGAATIQAGSKTEQVGELLVRMNNRTLLKQRVAIARSSDRQVPSLEWPDPVIVQIEPIFAARGGARTGRDLGPVGFEAIHTGFKCSNIGFERRYSLVELRKRKPHQRPHLFKFIPELIAQTLQLMPNRGVTFSDLSDIASE
jgi:hypothetical protein